MPVSKLIVSARNERACRWIIDRLHTKPCVKSIGEIEKGLDGCHFTVESSELGPVVGAAERWGGFVVDHITVKAEFVPMPNVELTDEFKVAALFPGEITHGHEEDEEVDLGDFDEDKILDDEDPD